MNLLDILLILIILSFFLIGFKNGVIREAVNLVGLIIVFVASYLLKGFVGKILCLYAPFIRFTGSLEGISSFNIFMYQTIAFLLVFSILLGVYAILAKTSKFIQKIVNMTIILILPSKILGGVVGIIKGWLIVFMALLLFMLPFGNSPMMRNSSVTKFILYKTPFVSSYTEKLTSSLEEVYDVIYKVSKGKIDNKDANVKCLDIMLKYKMVDRDTVVELVDSGKIENNGQIRSLLNNY